MNIKCIFLVLAVSLTGISCQGTTARKDKADKADKTEKAGKADRVDKEVVVKAEKCRPIVHSNGKGEPSELCATSGEFQQAKQIDHKSLNQVSMLMTTTSQTRAVLSNHSNHSGQSDETNEKNKTNKTNKSNKSNKIQKKESVNLCFSYQGEPDKTKALLSGAVRRQIGVKLKAQDSCNVLYVMWRFFPENKIVISRKLNPGMSTHSQCKNGGYKTVAQIPWDKAPQKGEFHSLKANLEQTTLQVFLDEKEIWKGEVEKEVAQLTGPVGIRTDNGKFMFQMDDEMDNGMNNGKNPASRCPLGTP